MASAEGGDIYLLSDSSGNLLEHFFAAVLTQFPKGAFRVKAFPFVKNETQLVRTFDHINGPGVLFHTVADAKLKEVIEAQCASRRLPNLDVIGPSVSFLERITGVAAVRKSRSVHTQDKDYLDRVEALEFALQHDDSRRIEDLSKADIVLVGISRVSKSPTSLFLAFRGFKVANVSLVPGLGLPAELEHHPLKNVAALTLQPKRLVEIRSRRFRHWPAQAHRGYEDPQAVVREVTNAEFLYKIKRWPIIDTTDLVVEEISSRILEALGMEPKAFG